MLQCNKSQIVRYTKGKDLGPGDVRTPDLVLRIKIRVTCLCPLVVLNITEHLRGRRPGEPPGMPPLVRLPFGPQQLSVRDDDVGRRLGRLDAVRPPLVVVLLPALRRHLDLGLRLELVVLLVAEGAEGGRGRVGVHAVVGAAVARAVALGGEEALPRLAGAVAHLRRVVVVHLQETEFH